MTTMTISDVAPDQLLSVQSAADLVGVCGRTIRNWVRAGKVTYVRLPGGTIRIVASSLWREGNVSIGQERVSQSPAMAA